jgi:hypothetical protein
MHVNAHLDVDLVAIEETDTVTVLLDLVARSAWARATTSTCSQPSPPGATAATPSPPTPIPRRRP